MPPAVVKMRLTDRAVTRTCLNSTRRAVVPLEFICFVAGRQRLSLQHTCECGIGSACD